MGDCCQCSLNFLGYYRLAAITTISLILFSQVSMFSYTKDQNVKPQSSKKSIMESAINLNQYYYFSTNCDSNPSYQHISSNVVMILSKNNEQKRLSNDITKNQIIEQMTQFSKNAHHSKSTDSRIQTTKPHQNTIIYQVQGGEEVIFMIFVLILMAKCLVIECKFIRGKSGVCPKKAILNIM